LVRIIPDFANILSQWVAETSSHIQKQAIDLGLSTSHYKKSDLGDTELGLMFQRLSGIDVGVGNWKQHYIAKLMIYLCAVRPGSFTVCPGSEQGMTTTSGEPCSLTGMLHRVPTQRNHRPPARRNSAHCSHGVLSRSTSQRRFLYGLSLQQGLPQPPHYKSRDRQPQLQISSDLSEFDLATIMAAHAFSRGLFPQYRTAEDLYNDNVMFLEVDSIISQQAVFAGVVRNSLMPEVAIRESALDSKLREMCEVIRQFNRNTMSSFRRGATKDTVI